MNILYISYDGATDPLGQSQIIPYLRQLSHKGNKFVLLTFDKTIRLQDRTLIDITKKLLKESNITWQILKYHKTPSLLATFYDFIAGIVIGWWLVRRNNINVIHARSYVAALIALCLKKITGCKFIFDMRGFWPEERVDVGLWKKDGLLYKIAKYFEKRFIINSDRIIVLTHKAKAIMEERYLNHMKKTINVIPTCVDLNLFSIKKSNNVTIKEIDRPHMFIFSYSGSIGTWYCIDEMINFFWIAKQKIENAYFLFLVTSKINEIKHLMLSKGFSEHDFLIKNLYRHEVPIWLSKADVSTFFIRPVVSKVASCPTKLGESLACGVPVIINSGIGDTEEIVKRERVGIVIEEFSDAAYGNTIEELRKLLYDRENLSHRCRRVAEDYFSLNNGVEKYNQVYLGLIKK